MLSGDIERIERTFGIRLPSSYRRVLEAFPLSAYAGNADTDLWDDADRLIEYNQQLRAGSGGIKPWPNEFFAIGRDGGSSQAIDLRTGDLWWADGAQLDLKTSHRHRESFEEWVDNYLDGLRRDLIGEGGDPAGTPSERAKVQGQNERSSARIGGYSWLGFLVALGLLILGSFFRRR